MQIELSTTEDFLSGFALRLRRQANAVQEATDAKRAELAALAAILDADGPEARLAASERYSRAVTFTKEMIERANVWLAGAA